jgi:transposase-like protein
MQNSGRIRRRSTPAQREKILRRYRHSQLTAEAFAAQAGIGVSTLHAWRQAAETKSVGGPAFVAVPNLLSPGTASAAYRLQWPGGLRLEVAAGFAAEELATLLQLLPAL